MNQYSNTLRGLSIAVIVLSILSLCGVLFGFIALALGHQVIGAAIIQQIQSDPELSYNLSMSGVTPSQVIDMVSLIFSVGWIALVCELITSVVTLIAGIFGMTGARDSSRYGRIFGWSLAGSIVSFLSGRIITMIIMIILTVFAYKAKNEATAAQSQGVYYQPVYQQTSGQAAQQQDYVYGYDPTTGQYVAMNPNAAQAYGAQPEAYAQPSYTAEAQVSQPAQPVTQQPAASSPVSEQSPTPAPEQKSE